MISKLTYINPYKKGQKIGVTFSAFDFIHPGHIMMLKDCKRVSEYLIVGIQIDPTNSSDKTYRTKTGVKNKPIYTIQERMTMIEGIKYVDAYFTYETEDDIRTWLKKNAWNIRILGSDWKEKEYTGIDIKKGEIYFHDRAHTLSSTEIKKRLIEYISEAELKEK